MGSLDSPLSLPHDAACSAGQGARSTWSTRDTTASSTRFARAFAEAQRVLLSRMELGTAWPLAEVFSDKLRAPMAEIRAFIDPIVRGAMARREVDGTRDEETLLGHLLDVTDGVCVHALVVCVAAERRPLFWVDMKVIVDETLNILLAGRDTVCGFGMACAGFDCFGCRRRRC